MRNLKSKILTKSNSYLTEVFGYSVGELAKQKLNGEFEGNLSKKENQDEKNPQRFRSHSPIPFLLCPPLDGPSNFFILQNELPEDFRRQCGLLDMEVSVSSPALTLLTLVATCINLKGGKISESEFLLIFILRINFLPCPFQSNYSFYPPPQLFSSQP